MRHTVYRLARPCGAPFWRRRFVSPSVSPIARQYWRAIKCGGAGVKRRGLARAQCPAAWRKRGTERRTSRRSPTARTESERTRKTGGTKGGRSRARRSRAGLAPHGLTLDRRASVPLGAVFRGHPLSGAQALRRGRSPPKLPIKAPPPRCEAQAGLARIPLKANDRSELAVRG